VHANTSTHLRQTRVQRLGTTGTDLEVALGHEHFHPTQRYLVSGLSLEDPACDRGIYVGGVGQQHASDRSRCSGVGFQSLERVRDRGRIRHGRTP